ncbi:hypothetical protein K456DRAFT_1940459 [Colletotrichum gloeosporioides 23]|nr:hypothetical protein K456DRAFT_1940459 [Colletotrichum gloeosporioides 23]
MPVTIQIADHPARTWSQLRATTPDDVLRKACPRKGDEAYDWSPEPTPRDPRRRLTKRNVIQSSFSSEYLRKTHITPSQNGFLWAVYHAYSNHHHLHIRPEDIWFAILTQLSFYINANSESLRSLFVEHEGRKKLEIRLLTSTMASTDFVASILFMGAMQNYFSYEAQLRCGLPSVTLQGDVADYEDILARLHKIEEFGDEPKQFVKLMRPILEHMIMSFDTPDSPQVEVFWNKVATFHSRGSGGDHVSGWLGVFSFWSASGQTVMGSSGDWQPSIVDGVPRMKVLMSEFAAGYASVPVIIIEPGTTHHCTMSAGSIGIQAARDSSGGNFDDEPSQFSDLTKIRSLTVWLMWEDMSDGDGVPESGTVDRQGRQRRR